MKYNIILNITKMKNYKNERAIKMIFYLYGSTIISR